jgi:hypothetical protein
VHDFFALPFLPLQFTFQSLLLLLLLLLLLARLRFSLHKEKGVCIRREELKRQLGRKLDASASKATSRSSQCDSCECAADGE